MTRTNVIVNAGDFLVSDAIDQLAASDIFSQAELTEMFAHLREHYERHHMFLTDEATAPQVGFFLVNRTLHILGYTHSHNEPLDEDVRIEYTLFNSSNAFLGHVSGRGANAFFNGATAIGKLAAWASNLDEADVLEDDVAGDPPAYELDEQLRATNLQWAFLTNGRVWRLFHKNTAAMLNTYLEIDLLEIIETGDINLFKIFASALSTRSLSTDKLGSSMTKKLLA